MSDSSAVVVYGDCLIGASILGGLINLFQFVRFFKHRHKRFLSSRYPQLIIVYCLISLITSIIVAPFLFYYELKERNNGYYFEFASEFLEEAFFTILLSIIVARSFLLYYDYNFAQAVVDQNWRGKIDPNEQNVWLKYRKTFGNIDFVTRFLFGINSVSLLGLCCVAVVAYHTHNVSLFHYFTLFGLGPLYTIFIVYLLYKIRRSIRDAFYIQQEITYLSTFVILRIVALLIDVIVSGTRHHHSESMVFFFTVEVFTHFTAVWVQSWWVLNKLKRDNGDNDSVTVQLASIIQLDNNDSMPVAIEAKMIDVLCDKFGFESLIRHCVNELSVENLLFCVEIAQFRYYLHNNCGNIHVWNDLVIGNHTEFVECILNNINNEENFQLNMQRFQEAMWKNKWVPISADLQQQNETAAMTSLSTDWIVEYSQRLYAKYVAVDADLCINVPAVIRADLCNVFGSDEKENVYEYIESFNDDKVDITSFIQSYLYHAFDSAFSDIWYLLRHDSFKRFKDSKEYSAISKKVVADSSV